MTTSPEFDFDDDLLPVGARRRSRERALSLLYEAETKHLAPSEILGALVSPPESYAATLVSGVGEHSVQIDELIANYAQAWAVDRMPAVDRAILRIATFELLCCEKVPAAVALDEAVDLAKQYSTEGSGRYVNGVLAAIAAKLRPKEVLASE